MLLTIRGIMIWWDLMKPWKEILGNRFIIQK
jgi:hypothetical protein